MRDENEFNAYVKKEIDRVGPIINTLKVSDRFHIGWSDFMIYRQGLAIAVESKFFKQLPKRPTTKILSHPLTGPQKTYLHNHYIAGVPGWVIIGYDAGKLIGLVPYNPNAMPEDGNWTRAEFEALHGTQFSYSFKEIPAMVDFMLGCAYNDFLERVRM